MYMKNMLSGYSPTTSTPAYTHTFGCEIVFTITRSLCHRADDEPTFSSVKY